MTEAPVVSPAFRHNARVIAPPPLNVKKGSDEWKLFKQMWTNYCIVARLSDDEEDYKRALSQHTLGQEGLIEYNEMQPEENHTLDDIINAFDNQTTTSSTSPVKPMRKKNVFDKRDQKTDESMEDYIAALRTLASTCIFFFLCV